MVIILTAAGLVLWVYQHDRYEPEPWHAVLRALLAGFAGMWIIGLVDDGALAFFHVTRDQIVTKAALVAMVEEGGKLVTVLLLAHVLLARHFNDPMDGLIYGRLAGLGMAVEESLLYLSLSPPSIQTLGVEVVRLFAHSLMGGLVGFAVGLGSHPDRQRRSHPTLVLACLGLSALLHFGWNVIAYSADISPLMKLVPMGVMLTMMFLWRWLCRIAEQRSREIFAPAVAA